MRVKRWWLILGILMVISTMVVATQYALTKVGYEFTIVHPSDAYMRFIGSDNSSDGIRVLRVAGSNTTNVSLTLRLGDRYSPNSMRAFSAAFGLVNEESYAVNITHINISSLNNSYITIWLHGNRTANANSTTSDPSSVLMYSNETTVNASNTTAWTLAAGDGNSSNMCYNTSDRANCSIRTPWDNTSHVRYSLNNTNAVVNVSDFVWVQIMVDIPETADFLGEHTGTIWIHFESDT